MSASITKSERERILIASLSTDADDIPKVARAGEVEVIESQPFQIMHNGLRVIEHGYYGPFVTEMVRRLRGHHEPQEEKVFHAVLASLRERPVMLELGSYWAYYTQWLLKERSGARAICVEPICRRPQVGERNLAANGLRAEVVAAAAGASDLAPRAFATGAEQAEVPIRSVDSLLAERGIDVLDVLHVDIQGFELQALRGASQALGDRRISWVFVSTHRHLEDAGTLDLHAAILHLLSTAGYMIVAAHTPEESFSVDGLVVARAPGVPGPDHVTLSVLTPQIRQRVRQQLDERSD